MLEIPLPAGDSDVLHASRDDASYADHETTAQAAGSGIGGGGADAGGVMSSSGGGGGGGGGGRTTVLAEDGAASSAPQVPPSALTARAAGATESKDAVVPCWTEQVHVHIIRNARI